MCQGFNQIHEQRYTERYACYQQRERLAGAFRLYYYGGDHDYGGQGQDATEDQRDVPRPVQAPNDLLVHNHLLLPALFKIQLRHDNRPIRCSHYSTIYFDCLLDDFRQ